MVTIIDWKVAAESLSRWSNVCRKSALSQLETKFFFNVRYIRQVIFGEAGQAIRGLCVQLM